MSKQEELDQDVFEAMLNGTFEEEQEEAPVEDEENAEEDTVEDENEDQEDTDQEEELEDEEELDGDTDGYTDEDSEDEDEDEEEDSLVDEDDSDDEDDDIEDEDEEAYEADESEDGDTDEESEDEIDTEENSDGDTPDTDVVDYKKFYEAVVNTEFVVNGRKVKGFADPQKIIQSQQMAGGFSEKMAGFKQYRPFMTPLKDRGMIDDPTKFDLAMNLLDGDVDAIKQHLKTLDIDPIDLDMDVIDYTPAPATASQEAIAVEETMERARASGTEERVRQIIGKEWDAESFQEFVSNGAVRNDLLAHIESGVYDNVQDKMAEMARLDYNGAFSAMNTVNKYRAAAAELQREAPKATTVVDPKAPVTQATKKNTVKAEKAKIVKARKEEVYKEKATKREAEIAKQRKRATSVSRKKPKAKAKAKFDPMEVEGEELDQLMEQLISGGR